MIKKDLDKSKVIKALQKSDKDVGSSEVQIGILTERIKYLTEQMNRFNNNISKTSAFVGMERSALHRKLKTLNIHGTTSNKPSNTEKESLIFLDTKRLLKIEN